MKKFITATLLLLSACYYDPYNNPHYNPNVEIEPEESCGIADRNPESCYKIGYVNIGGDCDEFISSDAILEAGQVCNFSNADIHVNYVNWSSDSCEVYTSFTYSVNINYNNLNNKPESYTAVVGVVGATTEVTPSLIQGSIQMSVTNSSDGSTICNGSYELKYYK